MIGNRGCGSKIRDELPILNAMPFASDPHPAPAEDSPVRARLSRILDGSDFPALSKQILDSISALDDDANSLQRLANVVLQEYSLTLSVVRTANSVHYRRSGRPIQSATHAMMMLGARTVRQLASSLLLFENYQKRSPALKELMLLSLLTANHARGVAQKLGMEEPEEAHLCGMFRNLGEVLVACHFPDDYTRIRTLMRDDDRSEAAALSTVLGFRYEDLGVEVSRHWGMPDSVVQGIRARATAAVSPLGSVIAFSHDLTVALYRGDADTGTRGAALEEVLERHAHKVRLTRDQIRDVVTDAITETKELFSSANIAPDRARMRKLSEAAHAALGVAQQATGEWEALTADDSVRAVTLRERLREELESKALAEGSDPTEVLLLALEGVLRGGPFDRVLACVLSADRTQLTARSGLGHHIDAVLPHFDFPMSVRGGPIVALLSQRQAVYLPAERSMNTNELRWAQSMGITQFGVFPIIVAGKIVGCLYADRAAGGVLPARATVRYVKSLTDLVVTAIARRRRVQATG